MKTLLFLPIIIALASVSYAETSLTKSEKEALFIKIQELEKEVKETNEGMMSGATKAFSEALNSDEKAFQLYKECFLISSRLNSLSSSKSTKANQRNMAENIPREFKRAIRYQLYWLSFSMDAANNPGKKEDQAHKIVKLIHDIVEDKQGLSYAMLYNKTSKGRESNSESTAEINSARKALGGKISPLHSPGFNSPYMKAYNISHLEPNNWPTHVLDLEGLYIKALFTPCLERKEFKKARAIIEDRILVERKIHENFGLKSDSGGIKVSLETFLSDEIPRQLWQSEQMLFSAGDQKKSTSNMLKLLENQKQHPDYLVWVKWLMQQLNPEGKE